MPARSVNAPDMRDMFAVKDFGDAKRLAQFSVVLSYIQSVYGVKPVYLLGPSRGSRKLSDARQTFQYLSHISFGHSYTAIAAFSSRDRTSVAHGCHRVEDSRDDANFDRALHFAELALTEIFQTSWEGGDDPGR